MVMSHTLIAPQIKILLIFVNLFNRQIHCSNRPAVPLKIPVPDMSSL